MLKKGMITAVSAVPVVCPYFAGNCQALLFLVHRGFNVRVKLSREGMPGVVQNGRTEKGGGNE